MKKAHLIGLVTIFFLLGGALLSPTRQNSFQPETVDQPPQTVSETPKSPPVPKTSPVPTIPTPTPTPSNNSYLSKLKKCLQDKQNDLINQEIKKDREILNNPNSTEQEKNEATARLSTNNIILALKYDCFGTNFSNPSEDDIENAWLVKDIDSGDSVVIERRNGEKWLLEAKTWCSWCWRYEGRQVHLKFGYTTSKLINSDGEVEEFWTGDEL